MKLSVKTVHVLFCATFLCQAQSNQLATRTGTPPSTADSASGDKDEKAAPQPPPQRKAAATSADGPSASEAPTKGAESADAGKRYVIGPLDVLIIRVWNSPNLSGPVDVGPDGILSMQLIGDVKADGLTREQLKEVLTMKLSEFLNNPEVDVTVARVNSKRYVIFGGVNKPGEFPLVKETTVFDALANAGGFKDFANVKKIYVLRNGKRLYFNFKDVSKGKNMEQNVALQNGDRIIVPE